MKTLKELKATVTAEMVLQHICTNYKYKMQGTRTLIVDNKVVAEVDDKLTYSGLGAKYNNSIKYDNQVYEITSAEFVNFVNKIAKQRFTQEKQAKQRTNEYLKNQKIKKEFGFCKRINEKTENDYDVLKTAYDFDLQFNMNKLADFFSVEIDILENFIQAFRNTGCKIYYRLNKNSYLFAPCNCNSLRIDLCNAPEKWFNNFNSGELEINQFKFA